MNRKKKRKKRNTKSHTVWKGTFKGWERRWSGNQKKAQWRRYQTTPPGATTVVVNVFLVHVRGNECPGRKEEADCHHNIPQVQRPGRKKRVGNGCRNRGRGGTTDGKKQTKRKGEKGTTSSSSPWGEREAHYPDKGQQNARKKGNRGEKKKRSKKRKKGGEFQSQWIIAAVESLSDKPKKTRKEQKKRMEKNRGERRKDEKKNRDSSEKGATVTLKGGAFWASKKLNPTETH